MYFNILRVAGLFIALVVASSCNNQQPQNGIAGRMYEDPVFSSFANFDNHSAKFRVGAQMDTFMYHFQIKAMTIAYFDDTRYNPQSIYILKHQSNDSLVITTEDTPLITYETFKNFYTNHIDEMRADTIIDPRVFDRFFMMGHSDIVDVESFQNLPFLFLDVNFNGYPALLVRKDVGQEFYYYTVYGITPKGFQKVNYDPYLSIKSRTNFWCFGGSTQFDFSAKTIKVFNLASGSCSDYGTQIIDIYKLNPTTEKFEKKQILEKYDYN